MPVIGRLKNIALALVLFLAALSLSNWIQIYSTNYYIGNLQKSLIEKGVEQEGASEMENIIENVSDQITKEDVKRGYIIGLLVAWVPWFVLGLVLIPSAVTCIVLVVVSAISYDPVWFNPLVFIVAFVLGVFFKRRKFYIHNKF